MYHRSAASDYGAMADDDLPPAPANEGIFTMDPEQTLRRLARQFTDGQKTIAELARATAKLHNRTADDPAAQGLVAKFTETSKQWHSEVLPSLAASMKLVLEVYDTFGPGQTRIDDPTDAAIWNNKYFVWAREFAVEETVFKGEAQ